MSYMYIIKIKEYRITENCKQKKVYVQLLHAQIWVLKYMYGQKLNTNQINFW